MTTLRKPLAAIVAVGLLLAVGCSVRSPGQVVSSVRPAQPASGGDRTAALADASAQGARAALDLYLDARVAGDYKAVYRVLSGRSQSSYAAADLERFFANYRSYGYRSVGSGESLRDGAWMRFPVQGVKWQLKGRPELQGEAWRVTVQYDGGRWGVALATPLFDHGFDLRQQNRSRELHRLADQMLWVDPWDFRGHLQKAYANMLSQSPQGAALSLESALRFAPAELQPEVTRVLADFLRSVGQPRPAAEMYRATLEGWGRYSGFYEDGFAAEAHLGLADIYQASGRQQEALQEVIHSQLLNPYFSPGHALAVTLALRGDAKAR